MGSPGPELMSRGAQTPLSNEGDRVLLYPDGSEKVNILRAGHNTDVFETEPHPSDPKSWAEKLGVWVDRDIRIVARRTINSCSWMSSQFSLPLTPGGRRHI